MNPNASESDRQTQRLKNMTYCYIFFIMFMLITPIDDCNINEKKQTLPAKHLINEKVWIIIYFFISFLQTLRDFASEYINTMHSEGRITYRTRSRLKSGIVISIESVHLIWQIYGNIIYFDQYDDKNVK